MENKIDFSKLNIEVDSSNNVVNAKDLIDYLGTTEIDNEGYEYLSTILNKLKFGNMGNVDELIDALSSKILEFDSKKAEEMNNQESLRKMQEANADLKKLGIKSTKRTDNDSDKYIDYLTYTKDDGTVEMLVCAGDNTLNDFIQKNADKITTMSADEIFHYFKEYVHQELDFEVQTDVEQKEDQTNVKKDEKYSADDYENERIHEEMIQMEDFKKRYGFHGDIQMAKDPINNERFYQLDGGIYKFQKVGDKLIRQTIQEPVINNDDLMSELNGDAPSIIQEETVTANDKTAVVEKKDDNHINYDDIPQLEKFEVDRFDYLLNAKDVNEGVLTPQEEMEFNEYIKYMIESIEKRDKGLNNPNEDKAINQFLDRYFNARPYSSEKELDSRNSRYGAIKEGILEENALSDIEIQFIEHYNENLRYLKDNGRSNVNNNVKKLQRIYNPNNFGVSTVVMLLEVALLAALILLFINIDI